MSQRKSISVAMCTFNGERFLGQQLESIAGQSRLPTELVICDDRSTDSTEEIVRKFAASVPFSVKFITNQANLGSSAKGITRNFERASRLCSSDLIVPCDQDDVWLPTKLDRMAQLMENNPELGGCFSDAQLINDQGSPKGVLLSETAGLTPKEQKALASGYALPILLAMTKVYGCSLMFDTRLLDTILPVPPNWWFDAWVACMVSVNSKLGFIQEPLFYYRIHSTQSVGASLPTTSERIKRWRRSAKEYWAESEPQLSDLYSRLTAQDSPTMKHHLAYVSGRMALLRFRAELSSNPIQRLVRIIAATRNYHSYFNGWKSMLKDITS